MGIARNIAITAVGGCAVLLSACNESDSASGSGVTGGRTVQNVSPSKIRHNGSSTLDGVKSIVATVGNGDIAVKPVLLGDRVTVDWVIRPSGGRYGDRVEDLDIVCELTDGLLSISEVWKGPKGGDRPAVEVTISMPRDLPLETSVGNGSVDADIDGRFIARVGNGEVQLAGSPAGSDINIGNGQLNSSCSLSGGNHSVRIGNGTANVTLAGGSSVSLDAVTAIGDASGSGFTSHRGQWSLGESLSGTLGTGTASLSVHIGNGNITVDG